MKPIKTIAIAAIAVCSFWLLSFKPATTSITSSSISSAINAARILWAKESHDFGEIPQGKPVSIEFTFTNNGDEPILVADVATSCGCTASDYSKAPIEPGKSSSVKVTYNAAAVGSFTKSITVNFSDVAAKKVLLIKGTVK